MLVELLTPGGVDGSGLGGKGRALAELVTAGYPVPATGVVTADAYRQVAGHPRITDLVRRITAGERVPAHEVDAAFASVPLDGALEEAIVALAATVGAAGGGGTTGVHEGDGGSGRSCALAVRSSATVEDLSTSSFAGQYRSLLDVAAGDSEAVLAAVRQVWASLWHPAPTAYRQAFDIDETDVAMAVVLMQMIPATTAGVVFTADPGGSDGARVEAVEGLGESLVSGQRTPRAWVVPAGRPEAAVLEAPDDGPPRPAQGLPVEVAQALDLSLHIASTFGVPEDVEWAAVGEDVYIVQARPITVLADDDGFDTPVDDHELTTGGIVEMVPGVLPALRWELNRFLLEEAFRSVLDSLGIIRGLAAEDRPFVRRVRGRAAIDFDQLRAAAADIPGAVEELEVQYFGASPDPDPDRLAPSGPGGPRAWKAWLDDAGRDLRTLQTRKSVINQADVVIQVMDRLAPRPPTLTDQDDDELLAYGRRLVDLAARGLAAELGVAAAAAASYGRLQLMLSRHLGPDEGARAAQRVTARGISADRRPTASAAVFGGPTWTERASEPPQLRVRHGADEKGGKEEVKELVSRLKSLPGWTRRRILTGQVVDVRVHLIRRTISEVVEQLHRREEAKAAVLELGGEVRRVHLELGRRLQQAGLLDDERDIELLATGEIVDAVSGRATVGHDTIRRRRNWLTRYEAEGVLPTRFTGVPDRQPEPLPEGDELVGWGASPGRHRGVARVLASADDSIRRGEVVVAQATDASWSPLFVQAGAIVVERGGPLSHAAILARELGLPCVMNLPGATGRLDGRTVVVDGDRGVVVIEREQPEEAGS